MTCDMLLILYAHSTRSISSKVQIHDDLIVCILISLSGISLEINSTLLTCTSITEKLNTKDYFNNFRNLTPESTFTLELEFARDICHFPLTATATPT